MSTAVEKYEGMLRVLGGVGGILIAITLIILATSSEIAGKAIIDYISRLQQVPAVAEAIAGFFIVFGLATYYAALMIIKCSANVIRGRQVNIKSLEKYLGVIPLLMIILGCLLMASSAGVLQMFSQYGTYVLMSGIMFLIGLLLTARNNVVGPIFIIIGGAFLTPIPTFNILGVAIIMGGIALLLRTGFSTNTLLITVSDILGGIAFIIAAAHYIVFGSNLESFSSFLMGIAQLTSSGNSSILATAGSILHLMATLYIIGGVLVIPAAAFYCVNRGLSLYGRSITRRPYMRYGPYHPYGSIEPGAPHDYSRTVVASQQQYPQPVLSSSHIQQPSVSQIMGSQSQPSYTSPQLMPGQQSQATAPVSRMCPQCGAIVPIDYAYCPR
ncbi:MAG: hypothetical protein GXO26_04885, partial [Crenarchaeota archaeon]|nr:hypothetical protein [Thermoproteota archaeon]